MTSKDQNCTSECPPQPLSFLEAERSQMSSTSRSGISLPRKKASRREREQECPMIPPWRSRCRDGAGTQRQMQLSFPSCKRSKQAETLSRTKPRKKNLESQRIHSIMPRTACTQKRTATDDSHCIDEVKPINYQNQSWSRSCRGGSKHYPPSWTYHQSHS